MASFLNGYNQSILEVGSGPMRAGKTEEFIRRFKKLKYCKGIEHKVFRPDVPLRDFEIPGFLVSRADGGEISIPCIDVPVDRTLRILDYCEHYSPDVVGIDEAHFFEEEGLLRVVNHLILVEKKNVVISGLDTSHRGTGFGAMPELLARADYVVKFAPYCEAEGCSRDARWTRKLVNGRLADPNSPETEVGDAIYPVRCSDCYDLPK